MIEGKRVAKIERDRKYKRKLKKICEETAGMSAYLREPKDNEDGWYTGITITKPYYRRIYWTKHKGRKSYKGKLKEVSNRIIRRSNGDDIPLHGSGYKKRFELWWMLY